MKMITMTYRWIVFMLSNILVEFINFNGVEAVCAGPQAPQNGWRSPDKNTFQTDEVVRYSCKPNFTLEGSPKVICLDSGQWDSKPPQCIDPLCVCQNGGKCLHHSSGQRFCFCMEGFRGPKCETATCKRPNDVVNGGFTVRAPAGIQNYDIGSELIFNCNQGYTLKGSGYDIRCVSDGAGGAKWSRSFPTCVPRKCKNQLNGDKLQNGKYEPNKKEYSFGEIISFTCNAGYQLRGTKNLRCTDSGLWSSVSWPSCFAKRCLSPAGLQHGRVIQNGDDFPAGSQIKFECKTGEGYYLFGTKEQTCNPTSNGDMIWTPRRPDCITKTRFEEYCVRQGKVMTMEPEPSCVHKVKVKGDSTTTRRNASIDTLTIVTGTAGGLLGFLLVIIAFVICQRRRMVRRMRLATSRRARSLEDERMLIYCSNDFHLILPSYDEAIRSRPPEPPPFDVVVTSSESISPNTNRVSTSSSQRQTSVNSNSAENSSNTGNSSPTENPYETLDSVTISPAPSQTGSSTTGQSEPVDGTTERDATSSTGNTELGASNTENGSQNTVDDSINEDGGALERNEAPVLRSGSTSSDGSTVDESQPLM